RHGMPGQKSVSRVSPKRFRGALDDFRLGAADIGYQRLRRQHWAKPVDEIEDRNHRRSQHHQIAAAHRVRRMGTPTFDGPALLSALQNRSAIAPQDSPGKPALLQGEPQRASDQPGSDDGDLLKSHKLILSSRA